MPALCVCVCFCVVFPLADIICCKILEHQTLIIRTPKAHQRHSKAQQRRADTYAWYTDTDAWSHAHVSVRTLYQTYTCQYAHYETLLRDFTHTIRTAPK
jgi:hypothetical protein